MATYIEKDETGAIIAHADWQFPGSESVDFDVVRGWDGSLYKVGDEPALPEPSIEERTEHLRAAIQNHLDTFVQTRNYDDIKSACTYAMSSVEKFRIEGQYAVDMRDATWSKAYELLAEYLAGIAAGTMGFPTAEEILSQLPALEWPAV